MFYKSTRNSEIRITAAQAITQGISEDGGLFVPESIPSISAEFIEELSHKNYIDRAISVLSLYLDDFTKEELEYCVNGAYGNNKFSSEKTAPVVTLENGANILELWHGPTCAFKDMALQLLPYLMTTSAKKVGCDKKIIILVATSGDTGKAALDGFSDVENTGILVFYPEDGVSPMQKLQMTTQEGNNVGVCAIVGNFDDAQTGVKNIFGDKEYAKKLAENGMMFSSANSINWGRLVPQIVYYISAYCDLLADGKIKNGDKINVVVPTGNFGNILAAFYAKEMGLPINKLICASNINNVLTDFLTTGTYDKNRKFHTTISPSMDILISSNLERLLYHLSGQNDEIVKGLMKKLATDGKYTISDELLEQIKAVFEAGCCDDAGTKETIKKYFDTYEYLCDTHTGVAVNVYDMYRENAKDETPTVIASTANPYKFSQSVLEALVDAPESTDEFSMVEELHKVSGAVCPPQLADLKGKTPRFTQSCKKEEMWQAVCDMLFMHKG